MAISLPPLSHTRHWREGVPGRRAVSATACPVCTTGLWVMPRRSASSQQPQHDYHGFVQGCHLYNAADFSLFPGGVSTATELKGEGCGAWKAVRAFDGSMVATSDGVSHLPVAMAQAAPLPMFCDISGSTRPLWQSAPQVIAGRRVDV